MGFDYQHGYMWYNLYPHGFLYKVTFYYSDNKKTLVRRLWKRSAYSDARSVPLPLGQSLWLVCEELCDIFLATFWGLTLQLANQNVTTMGGVADKFFVELDFRRMTNQPHSPGISIHQIQRKPSESYKKDATSFSLSSSNGMARSTVLEMTAYKRLITSCRLLNRG